LQPGGKIEIVGYAGPSLASHLEFLESRHPPLPAQNIVVKEYRMKASGVNHLVLLVLAVVGIASRLNAGTVVVVPPGLSLGDTYRLVFVTSAVTDATSTDISYYNNFVTTAADAVPALAALGATWTAIASTETVSAATNIGVSTSGIYSLNGLEVAAGTAALFNTVITPLLSPIDIDQNGDNVDSNGTLDVDRLEP
jgi:hypothetical protein